MLNILKITDIHFYDKNPSARLDNYTDSLIDKISQVAKQVEVLDVSAVVFCGDLFHDHAASRVSHLLVNRVLNALKSIPCPIYGIAGNHDLIYHRMDSLSKQPLGVIISAGGFQLLDDNPVTISKDGIDVDIFGVSYCGDPISKAAQLVPKSKYSVLCLHCIVTPDGGPFFNEATISHKTLTDLPFNVFALGHFHQDTGIESFPDNKFICNSGSLSRGSLHTDNITRVPKIEVYSFTGTSIRCGFVELDVKPSAEIFDLRKREIEKQEASKIKAFVASLLVTGNTAGDLSAEGAADRSKELLTSILNSDTVAVEVRDLILEYLIKAGLIL